MCILVLFIDIPRVCFCFQRRGARASRSSSTFWATPSRSMVGQGTVVGWTPRVSERTSAAGFVKTRRINRSHSSFLPLFGPKDDTTGIKSIYTVYQGHELMFHVSTMLPYSKENKQQVSESLDSCDRQDTSVQFY